MFKVFLYHALFAVLLGVLYYFFFEDATIFHVLIFVGVYLGLSLIISYKRMKKLLVNNSIKTDSADLEEVNRFIVAVGGISNIIESDAESTRLKIKLHDTDLINLQLLKELNIEGSSLSGSSLQLILGSKAVDFSRQISNLLNN